MRKTSLFAVAAAFIFASIGVWAASTTHARVEVAIEDHSIHLSQMMLNARDLPVEHWEAY
jgi:hypothetical protein